MTLAPRATAMAAPAARSRATITGTSDAIISGSSPTSAALCRVGSTAAGPDSRPP
jgi:hypothetical protein